MIGRVRAAALSGRLASRVCAAEAIERGDQLEQAVKALTRSALGAEPAGDVLARFELYQETERCHRATVAPAARVRINEPH